MSNTTKPPTKKRERAAWHAAARFNARGIYAIAVGPVVHVVGYRLHAPERTGGGWVMSHGEQVGGTQALTAEATLNAALDWLRRRLESQIEQHCDALECLERHMGVLDRLRSKMASP